MEKHRLICIALGCLLGCNSSPSMNAIPRDGIRSDAVGCWAFTGVVDNKRTMQLLQSPILARLDTTSILAEVPGRRAVRRLDGNGQVMLRDTEGFAPVDAWSADLHGDKIRVRFNNGLYGSTWVLDLPSQNGRVDTMRGRSKEFGDVFPAPDYPVGKVFATRINCVAAADSA